MLPDEIKTRIQNAYRQLLERQSLRSRYGQRQMIADIANTLADIPSAADDLEDDDVDSCASDHTPPVCVIEAGTGTGKTLAYLLGTLPLAQHLGRKVVISTATVALQEQILLKDIPDLIAHSDLEFTYTLAKGRGRYVCLSRLDLLLQDNASQRAMEELFGDVLERPSGEQNRALYQEMLERINGGQWQGDRDGWEGIISDADWSPVTVEAGQCAGQKCSNFSSCCFYQAREAVQTADCVVANHDLVLVDLVLGGGAILPAPEDTIYILDEAHHLPGKANQHFACMTRLRASQQWLDISARTLSRLSSEQVLESDQARKIQHNLAEMLPILTEDLVSAIPPFDQLAQSLTPDGREDEARLTFELGVVAPELRDLSSNLAGGFQKLESLLADLASEVRKVMDAGEPAQRQKAEQWFPLIGGMHNRAADTQRLWHHFALEDPAGSAPWARWLTVLEQGGNVDLQLACSPVLAADTLQEKLWSSCAGAVLTSATLSALGNFDVLAMRAGLPGHTFYQRISSPFDYTSAARFVVPRLGVDPGDTAAHTQAIVDMLPRVVDRSEASLMLFSSRRQMLDVLDGLDREWREIILCQDDYQKSQLLRFHRERIDRGEPSVIFGLASFAEGVDLPGKYCEHVLIAKLPFAVPNDPIESTLAQWLEAQGKNPFMTLSVPEAALRLVQASGRLLRSETDRGRITLFDERIVNRRYGRAILDSLPPFSRDIFPESLAR